jgi:predicted ATPase
VEREALSREMFGATRERMLREMSEALEVLTANQPLVLILEDLHWSDSSTLDLISYLATQNQPAHLMLIGTYRPVELIVRGHPLKAVKQELLAKQRCEELPLAYLSEEAITKYLSVRFPGNRFPAGLARLIRERTEGNPLFMVNAVDYLLTSGLVVKREGGWDLVGEIEKVEVGVPDSIKQMIEKQIDHLEPEEQRTLEAASVAGAEFSTLAVAAGLDEPLSVVEGRCDQLARRGQFIQDCGVQELPNGEAVGRHAFIHALYQNVLYERVSTSRRIELHRRIGERGEEVYGDSARQIAAELAMHFERGRDYKSAAKYHQQAADNAIRRFAYREAVGLARRGLELLAKLPDIKEHAQQELCLQLTLGVPLFVTEGYAASSVGAAYLRARDLLHQLGETPDVAEVLWGVWAFHVLRAELATAREMSEEVLDLAERLPYSGLKMRGHLMLGVTLAHMGQFVPAIQHADAALALYDPDRYRDDVFYYAQNPRIATLCHAAWTLWFLGLFDQSLARMQEGLTLATELSEPHGLAHTFYFSAMLHQLRREPKLAQERAEMAITVSTDHGLAMYQAHATIARGWALVEQGAKTEGVEHIRDGLAAHQATGAQVMCPHFMALLGEALGKTGHVEEGLHILDSALSMVARTGEGYYQSELYRLKGKLLLAQSPESAEGCFLESIKTAQAQGTKSCELRAATNLARVYRDQNKQEEARALLTGVYDWFTEGSDTRDLLEAKVLLGELSSRKRKHTAP